MVFRPSPVRFQARFQFFSTFEKKTVKFPVKISRRFENNIANMVNSFVFVTYINYDYSL